MTKEEKAKEKEEKKQEGFWRKIFPKKKVAAPNRVAGIYRRLNGTAEPFIAETKNGMFNVGGKTYHELQDCRYTLTIGKERLPFIDVVEDKLIPEGNHNYYVELDSKIQQIIAEHQERAIKAIRHAELVRLAGEDKPKPNMKLIIIIIIVAIIGFALLKNYL